MGGDAIRPVRPFGLWDWVLAVTLFIAVFLVYQPAWQGGLLWDDTEHVTRPELRSWHGLCRIWFDVRATPQYYPVVHTVFWVEHKLWGGTALGYHLVTIFMHATAALLVAIVLRSLAVPGAWLAAAIFALHPVHVESVAWLTEIKNTLSAVFYLSAALLYLRFDRTRKPAWYMAALALFLLALGSKTVTATLPGALLVIFWWQRGRLSWKRDVLPLAPFFLLGAGMGLLTAWWELEVNMCVGPDFALTPAQRILIATRGAWFHLGKLFWPANLLFIYPRWQVDPRAWWQYLFPLAVAALLLAAAAIRRRTRAPLAAVLYFGGTLVPVMGFFNLYTFRFSFIANHYQYLASLGIITLVSAGAATMLNRAVGWKRLVGWAGYIALLAVLAVLSWRQSRTYADAATLYQAIIDGNPDCWLAHSNLGLKLAARGQADEAIAHFRTALDLKPDNFEARNNLAMVLADCGRFTEAETDYRKALDLNPNNAEVHNNLANALAHRGKFKEAIAHYETALKIKPDYAEAHSNFAAVLAANGRVAEAIAHYQAAVEARPDYADAYNNLGVALAGCGRGDEAISQYETALKIKPDSATAHYNLGNILGERGQADEALAQFRAAQEIAARQGNRKLAEAIRAKIRLYTGS